MVWGKAILSKEKNNLLKKIIKEFKSKNIELIFLLAPYHPIAYTFLEKKESYEGFSESEKYINQLAHLNKIKIIGSFNPAI